MKTIIAIDPGKSGGYAVKCGLDGIITLHKMPESEVELVDGLRGVYEAGKIEGLEVEAVIETVGGYIGGKGAPGSSMFNFGFSTGFVHGALIALQIPLHEIRPQEWQKRVNAGNSKAHKSKSAWKRHLVNLAKKHFPSVSGINLSTADALLILEAHLK
jgi:hypothetical protein